MRGGCEGAKFFPNGMDTNKKHDGMINIKASAMLDNHHIYLNNFPAGPGGTDPIDAVKFFSNFN